jgi:hypothetical protein
MLQKAQIKACPFVNSTIAERFAIIVETSPHLLLTSKEKSKSSSTHACISPN